MNKANEQIIDIMNACKMAIYCKKGNFYPDKDFGSQIRLSKNINEMLSFVRSAVSNLDGVYVKSLDFDDTVISVNVLINDEERQVKIELMKTIHKKSCCRVRLKKKSFRQLQVNYMHCRVTVILF